MDGGVVLGPGVVVVVVVVVLVVVGPIQSLLPK